MYLLLIATAHFNSDYRFQEAIPCVSGKKYLLSERDMRWREKLEKWKIIKRKKENNKQKRDGLANWIITRVHFNPLHQKFVLLFPIGVVKV